MVFIVFVPFDFCYLMQGHIKCNPYIVHKRHKNTIFMSMSQETKGKKFRVTFGGELRVAIKFIN